MDAQNNVILQNNNPADKGKIENSFLCGDGGRPKDVVDMCCTSQPDTEIKGR